MLTSHCNGLGDAYSYYPTMAVIVTAKAAGRENAMAVAWHSIVSTHPAAYGVSISPKRFTHDLILRSGRFAVNFMPGGEAELIAAVGGCSGRDVDKFSAFRIKTVRPVKLDVPVLRNAYAALECKVESTTRCGDHDWFVGRIEASHSSVSCFGRNGLMKIALAKPTAYMGEDRYLVVSRGRPKRLDRKECVMTRKRKAGVRPRAWPTRK